MVEAATLSLLIVMQVLRRVSILGHSVKQEGDVQHEADTRQRCDIPLCSTEENRSHILGAKDGNFHRPDC